MMLVLLKKQQNNLFQILLRIGLKLIAIGKHIFYKLK
jgi:hypothetical protein